MFLVLLPCWRVKRHNNVNHCGPVISARTMTKPHFLVVIATASVPTKHNVNKTQRQQNTTSTWLVLPTRQKAKRLPVDYFMVTFTLPFELRVLARRQPKALYQLMFRGVCINLKRLCNTSRVGGNIGFTSVLHTHSRRRELHPPLTYCCS